ncbi:asparagine synthase (glutamine-hydrolyzing) [Mariprofundus erugo]|uniref:asparagine synthase (glutamine-hydrolyzing) n=1 Tax=Mariprofundus erugo TaxID=2528639 RepID=UPI0010FF3F02|nr:asparagine synthase (glutamine-hydrolyzing) [Mariprofundus erugo]TLS76041.1 asparagine synthase (glutamine-hydrolyzing) [Mariprofundus erugo]
MCGISGIFGFNSSQKESAVRAVIDMNASMADRGPDNQSYWCSDAVVLGHTRLAIMDPANSLANQPFQTVNWVLAFNGEIYNFRCLRKELEYKGYTFQTESDTEVLAALIEHYGVENALEKINGIFAFCAFNKNSGKLYLVRDRLGVKPLYYFVDKQSRCIWFASTPAAIVLANDRTWNLDYVSVFSFLHLGASHTKGTFFSGIQRLRGAQCLTVDANFNISIEYYWEPLYREGSLQEQVVESILGQKETHVNTAVFLSGGIDSSLMASILSDVEAFHLASPEIDYAKYMADHVGIKLNVREFTRGVEFDELLQKYSLSSGEASASSPIPLMVSQLISEHGYKVAFSANGADELFFGYSRTPVPELRPSNYSALDYDGVSVSSNDEQFYHIFRDEKSINIPKLGRPIDRTQLVGLYDIRPIDDAFPESAKNRWFELQTYVCGDLNPTLDFASMACSLEVRVPFLDHRLVELALSQDGNQLISSDFGRKATLKKMLKQRGVHPALWSRNKVGFSIPCEVLERRNKQVRKHTKELQERGLFVRRSAAKNSARDNIYLDAAIHALSIWARIWIDSGKVVMQ